MRPGKPRLSSPLLVLSLILTGLPYLLSAQAPRGMMLYAAGSVYDDEEEQPAIWDGPLVTILELPEGLYNGRILAMTGGEHLWSAGFGYDEDIDADYPVSWVDGAPAELEMPEEARSGYAEGIAAEGKALVASGYVELEGGGTKPVWWKDGAFAYLPLEKGMSSGKAASVALVQGKAWIAGIQENAGGTAGTAGYWKDGIWTRLALSKGRVSKVSSLRVDGAEIRVAGTVRYAPDDSGGVVWTISKSGTAKETLLPHQTGSSGRAVFATGSGSDAWATGDYGPGDGGHPPALWKNGKALVLSGIDEEKRGLAACLAMDAAGLPVVGGYLEDDSEYYCDPVLWSGKKLEPEMLDVDYFDCGQVNALAYAPAGLDLGVDHSGDAARSESDPSAQAALSLADRSVPADRAGISIASAGPASYAADNRGPGKRDGVVLDESDGPMGDFDLECTVRSLEGPANYGNGIIFRVKDGKGLLFNVTGDGRAAFYEYGIAGDQYAPYAIRPGQSDSKAAFAAVKSGAANALKVSARGGSIQLFVNGVLIGTVGVSLRDPGGFGLYVSAGNRVSFTDWKATPR